MNDFDSPLRQSTGGTRPANVRKPMLLYGLCLAFILGVIGFIGATAHAQTYSEETVVSGPCSACSVMNIYVADLDDDGDNDVVVGSNFPYIGWFENTNTGFSDFKRINEDWGFGGLWNNFDVADVTGDGKPEIFTSPGWYVNEGGGAFSDEKSVDYRSGIPAVADLSNDGQNDLVRAGALYYENPTYSGLEAADLQVVDDDKGLGPPITVANLNGDDKIDILGAAESDSIGWVENRGELDSGARDFSPVQVSAGADAGFAFRETHAADLDGDDEKDVLATVFKDGAQPPPSKIIWFENTDGNGSFGSKTVIAEEATDQQPTARPIDVDGDGDLDVVSFVLSGSNARLEWHENEGGGTFKSPKKLDNVTEAGRVRVGDLNGDGRQDVVFASVSSGVVRWYPNLKDGTLGDQRTIGNDLTLNSPRSRRTVDLNQDGLIDFLIGDSAYLISLKNTGTGYGQPDTLTYPGDSTKAAQGFTGVVDKINEDEYPDLVYESWDPSANNPFDMVLGWAENDGTGSFTYHLFGEEVGKHGPTTTADVDGDGDPDLINYVVGSGESGIKVYKNDGGALKGGSSNRVRIDGQEGAEELLTADLDGDGDEDLVANYNDFRGSDPTNDPAALVWFENTGNDWDFSGGVDDFSDAVIIRETSSAIGKPIRAVDLDSDGDLDLVQPGSYWHENLDGSGTFSDRKSLDLPSGHYRMADVDGDGDPDLFAIDDSTVTSYERLAREGGDWYGRRNIRWHENQGATFASGKILVRDLERPSPLEFDVSTPDLNQDGVPDFLYSSEDFQKLAWFKNEDPVVTRHTMAASDTTSFNEASTEIRLSSATDGSGTVTVRRPFSGPTNTGSIVETTVLDDRFVIEADTGLTVGRDSKIRVAVSSIPGIEDPTRVTFYRRDTTDRGTFASLQTTYDSDADELVVTTDTFGEFVPATTTDKAAPASPDSLRANGSTAGIDLTWTTSDSTDVAEYRVYRDTASIDSAAGPSELTPVATTAAGDTTYLDDDVQGGLTYYYRVTAVDDALSPNESGFSEEAQSALVVPKITDVRPPSGAPGTLVRIYGQEFAPTASNNTVRFGTATATVEQASSTLLRVRVPTGARGLAPVSVTRGAATARAGRRFDVANGGGTSFGSTGAGVEGLETGSVSWGDFDDDRDLDLVVTGEDSDAKPRAILYENKGSSGFEAVGAGLTGVEQGSASAWGDFDADGDLDLVLAGVDEDNNKTVTIYENKDGGTFEPLGAGLTGVNRASIDWGDYNGNGRLDLVVAGGDPNFDPVITIYKNKGGGTFESIGAGLTGARFGSVAWGDYNDDGLLDLVLSGRDPNNDPLTVIYKNKGSDTFESIGAPVTDTEEGEAVWGDYDADDDLDLAVTGTDASGNATATIYQNKGGDTFDPLSAGINGVRKASADWGDVNGDGAPDLVVAGDSTSELVEKPSTTIYENQGSGSFAAADAGLGGAADGAVAWGDYEGDGDLDLIVNDGSNLATTIYENQAAPPTASVTKTVNGDEITQFEGTGAGIQFSNTGGSSGDVTVKRYAETPDDTGGIQEENVSNVRLTITASGLSSFNAQLRLAVSRFDGIDDPTNVTVYKRGTGATDFTSLQTTVGTNGTPDNVSDDTLYATTSSFSEFVLASGSEPLPVEMANFEATVDGGKVALNWQTVSETNNTGFRIQRKSSGKPSQQDGSTLSAEEGDREWSTVGSMDGAGTTSEAQRYKFVDEELPYEADRVIYRLKQIDADGSAHYSETVTVERGIDELQFLSTFPNPTSQRATVQYALPDREEVRLRLYDTLGRRVRTVVSDEQEGRQEAVIDVGDLSSGVYFLRLRVDGQRRTQKITVVQ